MAARTLTDLYVSRCTEDKGKLVPHFWQPMAMSYRPFCLFADESRQFDAETNKAVELCMQRLIALGLELEIDVGKFVLEQSRREVPTGQFVPELLRSAVADEARHELGFKFAADAYGESDRARAAELKRDWVAMADKYQPLAVAGVLEQEVFLVTLGAMRVLGGTELNGLAMQIAKDESRHVATNRAITKWLGVELGKDLDQLVDETLAFAMGKVNVAMTPKLSMNFDFAVRSSRELKATGRAKDLDRVTKIAQHRMPFEIANAKLYTTRQTEDGKTVY